jgi:hypothetical protein
MTRTVHRGIAIVAAAMMAACGAQTPTTPTATTASPITETFFNILGPRGTASRTVTVSAPGTFIASLTSVSPSTVPVGFGVGIPAADNRSCNAGQSIENAYGGYAEISIPVEAGVYCVRVYDAGGITGDTQFSLTIVHP